MSVNNTTALKGILALCVVISHIYSQGTVRFDNALLHFIFYSVLGYVPVSVFFFLSGYGLAVSYGEKGETYIRNFPRSRLAPFYCICVLLVVIYTFAEALNGDATRIIDIVKSLTYGGTVIKFGWYLQTILVLYILFWIVYSFRGSAELKLVLMISANILFCASCFILKLTPTWYATSLCFSLGFIWHRNETVIEKMMSEKRVRICTIIGMLALAGVAYFIAHMVYGQLGEILQVSITSIAFTIAVISIIMLIPIKNKVTMFLGKISLEIYVIQGIMFIIAGGLKIENLALYAVLILGGTIFLAEILHPIVNQIYKYARRGMKK